MDSTKPAPVITEHLCDVFAAAADALVQRRAGDIPGHDIDDFIALGWMRWHGGSLQITPLGHMALLRIRARLAQAAA